MAQDSRAQAYDITQINTGSDLVRPPVISDTGLVVWEAYGMDEAYGSSHIMVYQNGSTRKITSGHPDTRAVNNVRPQVSGDSVAWVSSFTGSMGRGEPSWVLVTPPQKDDEPPELSAQYSLKPSTNAPLGTTVDSQEWILSTNRQDDVVRTDDAKEQPEEAPPPEIREISRHPSGKNEICIWKAGSTEFSRITWDQRNDLGVSIDGEMVAWQKAKGFPFGWEIMVWENEQRWQITTNFYYDMAPQVHGRKVTWYGWDGEDYEIFLYDHDAGTITQVTDNRFDDERPQIWGDTLVWQGFSTVEPDIFMWSTKTREVKTISDSVDDDGNHMIWDNYVVWQTFQDDDEEIILYDIKEDTRFTVTRNEYDDVNPDIRDGLVVWSGYHDNWDSEIFSRSIDDIRNDRPATMLTDNTFEDANPRTAGGRVTWYTFENDKYALYLATPKTEAP